MLSLCSGAFTISALKAACQNGFLAELAMLDNAHCRSMETSWPELSL
jgi:hypothetical protein